MKYFIGPEGPRTANLAIVAEKPGRDELNKLLTTGKGRPLIGSSGQAVDRHLIRIGTTREKVYLTNAVKHFDSLGTPTTADIKREQVDLFRELATMPNLNCIVAMGKAALLSLTNFQLGGIEQWRGSFWPSFINKKMTATFHPSHYMRGNWQLRSVVEFDLMRAFEQSKFPQIRRKEREYYVRPTFEEAKEQLRSLIGKKEIAFDVEGRKYLTAIGFATSRSSAFCIPITYGNKKPYWTVPEEVEIWRLIQEALNQDNCCYITQYGLSDCYKLWRHGIVTPYMFQGFDTMYAHRLIAPDLPHSLEFLTSIYTDQFFYKDEAGDWLQENSVPDDQFWVYNCKDCVCTFEVYEEEKKDMVANGLYDYFMSDMQSRFNSLLDVQARGMRINKFHLIETRNKLLQDQNILEEQLTNKLGWRPNVKSKKDMKRLFDELGIKYDKTPKGFPKTNKERMLTYATKSTEHAQQVLGMCLEVTNRRTLVSNFFNMRLDYKDFYHPVLDLSHTKSGRDSSTGSDEGGPQIQNIPEFARRVFIADNTETQWLVQADLKQAEAMFVAYDAEDLLLIETFEKDKDVHRVNGCVLFRGWNETTLPSDSLLDSINEVCPQCAANNQKKCNHSERYIAKQTGHASNYLEGPRRLVVEFAQKGVFITESEAKILLGRIVSEAKHQWHERIKQQLSESPWLENPLGRKREFFGVLDHKMLREALAWLASSTISVIRDRAWMFLYKNLPHGCRLLTNTHDSILICALRTKESECRNLFEEAFYQPIQLHGRTLNIPIEISIGENWGSMK